MRAALLACTAIRSGVCLIPLYTGFFAVPVEYPWPRVLFRRWPFQKMNGTASLSIVYDPAQEGQS